MEGKLIKLGLSEGYRLDDLNGNYIASTLNGKNKLSLKNCQAIENGYDLMMLAEEDSNKYYDVKTTDWHCNYNGFFGGFRKALEILADKKYTETELYHAFLINSAGNNTTLRNFFEQTVLPMFNDNAWDVEIVMDRDCYSSAGRCDKLTMADCIICTPVTYLKDEDGCLILKRK